VLLRKFGQEVIRATAGKRVHGTGSVPGGMNRHLLAADAMRCCARRAADAGLGRGRGGAGQALHAAEPGAVRRTLADVPANMLSLVRPGDGALELYDGVIRVRDADGRILLDNQDVQDYLDLIEEEVKPWTYMKFPYLRSLGRTRAGTAWARWRGCRTATSSPARAPRRAPRFRRHTAAGACTPRWPTTGRA
jgi:NAD-reducing hydrogenase large subunit